MNKTNELVKLVREGEMSIEEGLEKADIRATKAGNAALDSLVMPVISTGFPSLDRLKMLKLAPELIVLGARPGQGKTALMLQLAANVASEGAVLFQSLEMGEKALETRLLALESGVSINKIQEGTASQRALRRAQSALQKKQLYFDCSPGLTVKEIHARAIDFKRHRPLKLIVIDYLHIISEPTVYKRSDSLGLICDQLIAMSKEIGVPTLVGAQLNRACEERGKRMEQYGKGADGYLPIGSDIAESDKVQHKADVIAFISREEVYNGRRKGTADVGVYKNRNAATGWAEFDWVESRTCFRDRKRGTDTDQDLEGDKSSDQKEAKTAIVEGI